MPILGISLQRSPIFVTLMKEAPGSSETSVLTRATRRNNPEDTIRQDFALFVQFGNHIKMNIFNAVFMCLRACTRAR
jgi:hypothetical protein